MSIKAIILLLVSLSVIAAFAISSMLPANIFQTGSEEFLPLWNSDDYNPYVRYAQSFVSDGSEIDQILIKIQRISGSPLQTVGMYLVKAEDINSWVNVEEGPYVKRSFVPCTNTGSMMVGLSCDAATSAGEVWYFVIQPVSQYQGSGEKYGIRASYASPSGPYADGVLLHAESVNSQWSAVGTAQGTSGPYDAYFMISTTPEDENHAPVAAYSPDGGTYSVNTQFTLDASASYDEDDDTIYCRWKIGNNAWTSWSTTRTRTTSFSVAGTYTIELEVADSQPVGLTDSVSKTFYITDGGTTPTHYNIECSAGLASVMINAVGSGYNQNGVTDANGFYTFTGCVPGSYTLTYTKTGYQTEVDYKTITYSDVQSSVTMEVDDPAPPEDPVYDISFTISDTQGMPIVGAVVKLVAADTMYTLTASDQFGIAMFEGIEEGTYQYFVQHTSYDETTGYIAVNNNVNKDITLLAGGGVINAYLIVGIMVFVATLGIAVFIPGWPFKILMVLIGAVMLVIFILVSMGVL